MAPYLTTIAIGKLRGEPYRADFWFCARLLGPYVLPGVLLLLIGLGLLAFLIFGITYNTQASEQPQVVRVNVKDYQVDLSQFVVTSGRTVRFDVENSGTLPHQLTVQALSASTKLPNFDSPVIGPGTSRTVQFTFQPGVYRIVCSVADHVEKGMVNVFAADTVRSASFPLPMNIVIPQDDKELAQAFNDILKQLKSEGFIDQLATKYFSAK